MLLRTEPSLQLHARIFDPHELWGSESVLWVFTVSTASSKPSPLPQPLILTVIFRNVVTGLSQRGKHGG